MVYVKMANRTLLCNLCFDARSVIFLLADNRPISLPVSSLPLSSETDNKNRNHQILFRFYCACVKLFTHLTKRRSQGNFALIAHWYMLGPKQFFFLYVSFDRCIQCQESNVKGPFKELKRIFVQLPRRKHSLVIPAHILLSPESA